MLCKTDRKTCLTIFILAVILSAPAACQIGVNVDEVAEPAWRLERNFRLEFPTFTEPGDWDNSCSQYASANLLTAIGMPITKQFYDSIGREINPDQTGVPSADLLEYLRAYFSCEEIQSASFQTLWTHMGLGYPVIATVEHGGLLHTVIITGYGLDHSGGVARWFIADNGLMRGVHTQKEFAGMWRCPSYADVTNYCVLIRPHDLSLSIRARHLAQVVPEFESTSDLAGETSIANVLQLSPSNPWLTKSRSADQLLPETPSQIAQRLTVIREELKENKEAQAAVPPDTPDKPHPLVALKTREWYLLHEAHALTAKLPFYYSTTSPDQVQHGIESRYLQLPYYAGTHLFVLHDDDFTRHLGWLKKAKESGTLSASSPSPYPTPEEEITDLDGRLDARKDGFSTEERQLMQERLDCLRKHVAKPGPTDASELISNISELLRDAADNAKRLIVYCRENATWNTLYIIVAFGCGVVTTVWVSAIRAWYLG